MRLAVSPSFTSTPTPASWLNFLNLAGSVTAFQVDVGTSLHCFNAKAVILSAWALLRNSVPLSR